MPETDLTITGSTESKYISLEKSSRSIVFSENTVGQQLQFIVNGERVHGSNEHEVQQGIIMWKLGGINANAYKTPDNITVTVVNCDTSSSSSPELAISPPTEQSPYTLSFRCSQPGILYYVISQDQQQTQIPSTQIIPQTIDNNLMQTELGIFKENPARTFYGYRVVIVESIGEGLGLEGKVQSEAMYYARMYCVNRMGIESEAKDISWKQKSNSAKPIIITMNFISQNKTNGTQYIELSSQQKKEVACIICKVAKLQKDKVYSDDALACNEDPIQIASTNSTNTTLRRLLQTSTNQTQYFIIQPDQFSTDNNNNNQNEIEESLKSEEFSQSLQDSELLNDLELNSFSCSSSNSAPVVPQINPPYVYPAENNILFQFVGANNTNGFLYLGLIQQLNSTSWPDPPNAVQIQTNLDYQFKIFNKTYYEKQSLVEITIQPVVKCMEYKFYWIATNEDAESYEFVTGVKEGKTKTIGCPVFAVILRIMTLFGILFAVILA